MATQQCCVAAAVGFGKFTSICVVMGTNWGGGGCRKFASVTFMPFKNQFYRSPEGIRNRNNLIFFLINTFLFPPNANGVRCMVSPSKIRPNMSTVRNLEVVSDEFDVYVVLRTGFCFNIQISWKES